VLNIIYYSARIHSQSFSTPSSDYGIEYSRGDMVIEGTYFFQVSSHDKQYLAFERFNFEKTFVQFSYLVIGTKLHITSTMLKGKECFELQIREHECLLDAIINRS
jgi:hypothetical protein